VLEAKALRDKTMPIGPYDVDPRVLGGWGARIDATCSTRESTTTRELCSAAGLCISTRRTALGMSVVRRELEIVRTTCTPTPCGSWAVTSDDDGLFAEIALGLGLEVWFSPAFFEYPLEETGAPTGRSGRGGNTAVHGPSGACGLRTRLVVGKSVTERLQRLKGDPVQLSNGKLDEYLAVLMPRLRAVFDGPAHLRLAHLRAGGLGTLFDYVGVDHYREGPDQRTAT